MPILIPLQGITVHRAKAGQPAGGKEMTPVIPTIGQPFEFTDDEVEFLMERAPESIREPVNEAPAAKAAPAPAAKGKAPVDPGL